MTRMSEGNNSAYNNSTISNRNQQAAIHSPQHPFNQPSTNFQFTRNSVPDYAHALVGARWLELITDHAQPDGPLRRAQLQRLQGFSVPGWDLHQRRVQGLLDRLSVTAPAQPLAPGAACVAS